MSSSALFASCLLSQTLYVSGTASKPNIVFVMADDLGWGEVGSYPGGSTAGGVSIKTPFLDQFAKDGMRFTNAYAGYTVCAPSRNTLMTGRHSGNFGKHGYFCHPSKNHVQPNP
jgi:arylsulfatase A-like enzyme